MSLNVNDKTIFIATVLVGLSIKNIFGQHLSLCFNLRGDGWQCQVKHMTQWRWWLRWLTTYALEEVEEKEEKNINLLYGCIYLQSIKTFSSARPLLERISLSLLCIYISLTYISYKTDQMTRLWTLLWGRPGYCKHGRLFPLYIHTNYLILNTSTIYIDVNSVAHIWKSK